MCFSAVYFIIPPYGSMVSLLYVRFFLFVCTVMDFSVAEKDRGVKFCMRVRLLSGMSFSHFGELWLVVSHNSGISSGMYAATNWIQAAAPSEAQWGSWNWGRWC